jgi:hypothetical protein
VNALFYQPFSGEIMDPVHGGRIDLENKTLRAVGNPRARIEEDGLRILRAVRLCARLGFSYDPETWNAMKESVADARLQQYISVERICNEVFAMLGLPLAHRAFLDLDRLGFFSSLLGDNVGDVVGDVSDRIDRLERVCTTTTAPPSSPSLPQNAARFVALFATDSVSVARRLKTSAEFQRSLRPFTEAFEFLSFVPGIVPRVSDPIEHRDQIDRELRFANLLLAPNADGLVDFIVAVHSYSHSDRMMTLDTWRHHFQARRQRFGQVNGHDLLLALNRNPGPQFKLLLNWTNWMILCGDENDFVDKKGAVNIASSYGCK